MGIPGAPGELIDALRPTGGATSRAVAIVGSGLSLEAGAPSWPQLLEGLAVEVHQTRPPERQTVLEALRLVGDHQFTDAAAVLKQVIGHQHFGAAVARQITHRRNFEIARAALGTARTSDGVISGVGGEELRELRPTHIQRLLAHLRFRAIITTNYDLLLEHAQLGECRPLMWSYSHIVPFVQEGHPFILKLHGDITQSHEIILARDDYPRAKGLEALDMALKSLFTNNFPFWIGYGHSDPHLDELIDQLSIVHARPGVGVAVQDAKLQARFKGRGFVPAWLTSYDDVAPYLEQLAVAADRQVVMTVVLRGHWPGDPEARRLGEQLGEKLEQLQGRAGDATVWRVCRSSRRIYYDVPWPFVTAIRERVRDGDPRLLGVIQPLNIASIDGIPVPGPAGNGAAPANQPQTPATPAAGAGNAAWFQTCNPQRFIDQILDESRSGRGFVPFVGTGISAAAGIPPIQELEKKYFVYCLEQVLKSEWSPRRGPWPKLGDAFRSNVTPESVRRRAQAMLADEHRGKEWKELAQKVDNALVGGQWREMLRLLSRIVPGPGASLSLGPASDDVIDELFARLTDHRSPTLGHLMLAHLSDALRIETILSVNFDSLIELAFQRVFGSIRIFGVHRQVGFPAPTLVLAQRALVKVNGGRYGIRATLDGLEENPSASDKDAFCQYLAGKPDPDPPERSQNLLVLGFSGNDKRVLTLMAEAAKRSQMNIFWVCYTERERNALQQKLELLADGRARVWAIAHPDLGLLLLELYQKLTLSLPPAAVEFAAVSAFPPYAYGSAEAGSDETESPQYPALRRAAEELKSDVARHPVVAFGGAIGVSSVASIAFHGLRDDSHCLWLDLDDFSGLEHFYAALVNTVARALGLPSPVPLLPRYSIDHCRAHLAELMAQATKELVVFLNGREGVGSNAGLTQEIWRAQDQADFWRAMSGLPAGVPRFRLVILYGAPEEVAALGAPPSGLSILQRENEEIGDAHEAAGRVVSTLIAELSRRSRRHSEEGAQSRSDQLLQFVLAACLMRRPRHVASLWSWAFLLVPRRGRCDGRDNDRLRFRRADSYRRFLARRGVGRLQPGGGMWINDGVRRNLLQALGVDPPCPENCQDPHHGLHLRARAILAERHQAIADWYVKLFRASNDPNAALESVYHRLCCADAAKMPGTVGPSGLHETALLEALATMRLSCHRIAASGYAPALSAYGTHLLQRCADLTAAELSTMKSDVLELLRDCARHVANFADALSFTEKLAPPRRRKTLSGVTRVAPVEYALERATDLMGLRAYDSATKCFQDAFSELHVGLGAEASELDPLMAHRGLEEQLRQRALDRLSGPGAWSAEVLKLAIKTLRRYTFLLMLQAQSLRVIQQKQVSLCYQVAAERRFGIATALMRSCNDEQFVAKESVRLRGHASVLMANLGRFDEGHSRINEATGFLMRSRRANDSVAWGIVELRRAEIDIRQALGDEGTFASLARPGSREFEFAHLRDASHALDSARGRFEGRAVPVWWRTLHCELRLALAAISAWLEPVPTVPRDLTARWLKMGTELIHLDAFRCARLAHLWIALTGTDNDDMAKHARSRLQEVQRRREELSSTIPAIDPNVAEYIDWVAAGASDWENRCII
jgi:hypothetical protein